MPLSINTIRNAKPTAKPYKLTDEKGLFLLVQPSGGMLWPMNFRIDGRDTDGNAKKAEKKLGFTPYETICKTWLNEPHLFTSNPTHQIPGPNI